MVFVNRGDNSFKLMKESAKFCHALINVMFLNNLFTFDIAISYACVGVIYSVSCISCIIK